MVARLSEDLRETYHRKFTMRFEGYLDRGLGECRLREPRAAEIAADSLRHFDEVRYELCDFVVMPNHVHVIVGLVGDHSITDVCRSWKKFTATAINQLHGRSGPFWQSESFDHLVRSAEHCERFCIYIRRNPERAGLNETEFLLGGGSASRPLT